MNEFKNKIFKNKEIMALLLQRLFFLHHLRRLRYLRNDLFEIEIQKILRYKAPERSVW